MTMTKLFPNWKQKISTNTCKNLQRFGSHKQKTRLRGFPHLFNFAVSISRTFIGMWGGGGERRRGGRRWGQGRADRSGRVLGDGKRGWWWSGGGGGRQLATGPRVGGSHRHRGTSFHLPPSLQHKSCSTPITSGKIHQQEISSKDLRKEIRE